MKEGFFSNKKLAVTFTLVILIVGSILYFSIGKTSTEMNVATKTGEIYGNIKLKSAYTPEGQLKVFALAKNNQLKKLDTSEGDSIPEYDSIVIGSKEAEMMKKEKLFNKTKDELRDFFGLDLKVEGILLDTDSVIDDVHFVGEATFRELNGEDNKLFIKINNEGLPKLFYYSPLNKTSPIKFKLKEGNFSNYIMIHEIAGEKYYPMFIGSKEAEMMKKEKLFSKPGDIIKGLFGKNFIVAGVISPTNTALDMAHIVPLNESELAEANNESN